MIVVNPPPAELQRGYPELLRMDKGMDDNAIHPKRIFKN
jgi:hypothetical protein